MLVEDFLCQVLSGTWIISQPHRVADFQQEQPPGFHPIYFRKLFPVWLREIDKYPVDYNRFSAILKINMWHV